jgi:hypothetical protein
MAKKQKKEIFQKPDFGIGTQFTYSGFDAIIKWIDKDNVHYISNGNTRIMGRMLFEDLVREGII